MTLSTARLPARFARWVPALAAVAVVLGCGGGGKGAGDEAVARVNQDHISTAQLSFLLAQQRNLRPEQAEAASRQILDRLVEQQLAIQKAQELKLENEPAVQMALDLARREVLSRAYLERTGEAAPKPTPDDIKSYFNDKPALFKERRIYSLQEIGIEARPEQLPQIRERLPAAKNTNEFVEYLKSAGFRFAGNQAVRAAEQLPFNTLDAVAKMKDGQAMVVPTPTGAQVVVLVNSRSQPVTEEQARSSIEQYLLAERRRKLVEADMKSLRAAAKIEYLGKFAAAAPATAASGGDSKGATK